MPLPRRFPDGHNRPNSSTSRPKTVPLRRTNPEVTHTHAPCVLIVSGNLSTLYWSLTTERLLAKRPSYATQGVVTPRASSRRLVHRLLRDLPFET